MDDRKVSKVRPRLRARFALVAPALVAMTASAQTRLPWLMGLLTQSNSTC